MQLKDWYDVSSSEANLVKLYVWLNSLSNKTLTHAYEL